MRVVSSYIRSIDYDSISHTMTVTFVNNCVVKVFSVHPKTYKAIVSAESHGQKFTDLVRDKHKFVVVKKAAA